MATLYSSFRLNITKRIADGAGFIAITEMKLMNVGNVSGPQLLTGGVATASSIYGPGYEAINAFDTNTTTRWATDGGSFPGWIRYDLPSPIEKPKFIYLLLNNSPSNGPSDFTLEGSSDNGVTWEVIFSVENFATAAQLNEGVVNSTLLYGLGGYAVNSNGVSAKRVIIYDWVQGGFLKEVTPGIDGSWVFTVTASNSAQYLVVAIGDDGDRPQAHGPVLSQELG